MPESSAALTTRDDINTPSSPIFELDNDILWCIFSFNADMELKSEMEIPALLTLRYTSQVCPKWRALITGSPSLWAPVLNFNLLSQKGEQWRMEVIRRTGTAPLHIRWKDDSSIELPRVKAILRQTVKENWARIQSLNLHFSKFQADEPEQWAAILQCPAPSLQMFRFFWPQQVLDHADFVLFANNAPLLQRLYARNVKLNLVTFPISNLRSLSLRSSISVLDMLRSLREMKLLETLSINSTTSVMQAGGGNPIYTSLPRVIVPRLTTIVIYERQGANDSLSLLRQIIPAMGCVLFFHSCFFGEWSNDISLELCHNVLATYSAYCTQLTSTFALNVRFGERFLSFSSSLPSGRYFFFALDNHPDRFPHHALPTLLPSLTTIQLNQLRKLEINASFTQPQFSDPPIVGFILAFVSVKVLITDCQTLRALTVIQSNTKVVTIPALETIDLRELLTRQSEVSIVRDFLNSRIELGASMDAITLKIKPVDVGLELLEEVQGLLIEIVQRDARQTPVNLPRMM